MIVISAIKFHYQFSFFFLFVNGRYTPHLKNNWSLHYSCVVTSRYMYYKCTSNMSILVNICLTYMIYLIYLLGITKEKIMF